MPFLSPKQHHQNTLKQNKFLLYNRQKESRTLLRVGCCQKWLHCREAAVQTPDDQRVWDAVGLVVPPRPPVKSVYHAARSIFTEISHVRLQRTARWQHISTLTTLEPNSTTRTPATDTGYEHQLRTPPTNTTNGQKICHIPTSWHVEM